jgi:energy-coupling factor transporter ATP-binding protein EcfA2
MIEIVATNDPDQVAAANIKASEKLKARKERYLLSETELSDDYKGFSELIDVETAKYEDAKFTPDADASENVNKTLNEAKPQAFSQSDIAPAFSRISTELHSLFDGTMALTSVANNSLSNHSKMKMLGFSNKTITNLLDDPESNIGVEEAIKKFTRTIVQGKSLDFDASQIILVCGSEGSGKTVLSKKLAKFLPTKLDGLANRVISDPLTGDLSSLFKSGLDSNITSLFRKRQDVNLDGGKLIVDYEGPTDVLSSVLMKLNGLEQKPNVSIVYALEVGKSYNAVQQILEISQIPNLCIALTKMDLLEVSVNELSAISDLGKKIQFFSGLKVLEDGLDFAKVSVMEDFLNNLVKQEGW